MVFVLKCPSIGTISALATWLAFLSKYGYLPILIIGPDNNGWLASLLKNDTLSDFISLSKMQASADRGAAAPIIMDGSQNDTFSNFISLPAQIAAQRSAASGRHRGHEATFVVGTALQLAGPVAQFGSPRAIRRSLQ
eukprot:4815243-Pleurochrysis_carterae.AAC.1